MTSCTHRAATSGRTWSPTAAEPSQVLGRDRFLEPGHPVLRGLFRDPYRLAGRDPPLASTKNSVSGPDDLAGQGDPLEVPVLAGCPRSRRSRSSPLGCLCSPTQPTSRRAVCPSSYARRAAAPETVPRPRLPEQLGPSAPPSSRALRSHSAMSPAEMAVAAFPGRPMFAHRAGHGLSRSGHVQRAAPDHRAGQPSGDHARAAAAA